jgi:hypothetical protein
MTRRVFGRTLRYEGDHILVYWEEIESELVAPLTAIMRLYEPYFKPDRHPFSILSKLTTTRMKKLLTKPEFEGQHNFARIKRFLTQDSGSGRRVTLDIKLSAKDDWWLQQFGLTALIRNMKTGFEKICQDIEVRERKRNDILQSFVQPKLEHPVSVAVKTR